MGIATVEVLPPTDYRGAWTIKVTGEWAASTATWDRTTSTAIVLHPDFPLTPDGTPKVVLTVQGSGYTRSGGEAVATTYTRTIVGTTVVRKPFPDSSSTVSALDETHLGGGVRVVYIALSEPIYAGETVTATFLSGWRTGHAGGSGIPVTNNSTRAVPLPAFRWAMPQMMPVIGVTTHRVDALIASHHPRHFGAVHNQAVAGVKFELTDTTTTKTLWVTQDSASTLFDDNLFCWGGTLDFSGLNPGMVQCRATVYPWIGAARTIGFTALTSGEQAYQVTPDIPLLFGYDPADTFFNRRYVAVDAATGTTTPGDVTVATSIAAAKAGTRAATLSVAIQAMRTVNFTLAAANGWASVSRASPYWEAIIMAGAQGAGSLTVSTPSGLATTTGAIVVRGDPDDANPRVNCRFLSQEGGSPSMRNTSYFLRNLRLELGGSGLLGSVRVWADNVTIRRRSGATNETSWFTSGPPAAGNGNVFLTRFDAVEFGDMAGANNRAIMLRNGLVASARGVNGTNAKVLINLEAVRDPRHSYVAGNWVDFNHWDATGSQTPDNMYWNCRSLWNNGRIGGAAAFVDSNGISVLQRTVMVNCLIARAGPEFTTKHLQIGENANVRQVDCIWESSTLVGNRSSFHNDPPIATNNLVQTGNFVRNLCWDRWGGKDDTFPTASGNRTGSFEIHYAVGHAGNVIAQRSPLGSQFSSMFYGLRTFNAPFSGQPGDVSVAAFVDDQCNYGPNSAPQGGGERLGAGGGDYRPGAGSALLGRAAPCNTGRDINGVVRGAAPASGALEPAPTGASLLLPGSSYHEISGSGPALSAPKRRLLPLMGLHITRSAQAVLDTGEDANRGLGEARVRRVRAERRTLGAPND